MRKLPRLAITGATLLLVTNGCVPQAYQAPALVVPAQWQEKNASSDAAQAAALQDWWRNFGDAQLDALVDEALRSSLDIRQAQLRIDQARAEWQVAGAARYPTLDAAGSVGRVDTSDNLRSTGSGQPVTTGPTTNYRAGFDASWELDFSGRIRQQLAAAEARYEASVEDFRAVQVSLLGEVAGNYIALRNNQQQREIVQKNIATQRDTLALTQERYTRGLASYVDVAQAQTQLASTESLLPVYDTAIKQSMRQLAILLGREPGALARQLSTIAPVPAVSAVTVTGLPSDLLDRRPDLRREERNLAAAAADVGVAKAERYPSFDLTMGLGLESVDASRFSSSGSRYWSLVPAVRLPLLDGGKISANITGKQARYEEARYHYQDTFNRAVQDVENSLTGFYAENSRCQTLRESERSARVALDLAQQRYRSGLDSFLNVLITQRALYLVQSNLVQTEADRSTRAVALYKALGGGWQ